MAHQGFCIGFDPAHEYFENIKCVRYRRQRTSFNGAPIGRVATNELMKHIHLEKPVDWSYEEEERLFLEDAPNDARVVGKDEYGQDIVLNKLSSDSINSIYLGLRVSDEFKYRVVGTAIEKGLKVDIYEAERNINEFSIVFVKIFSTIDKPELSKFRQQQE
jgi:hypothetical protein